MNIAIPISHGELSAHFGHAEKFRFYTIDPQNNTILKQVDLTPPPHEPGVIPRWIGEQQANILIVGGVGQKAIQILNRYGVEVVSGATSNNPDEVILQYLNGGVITGGNSCNH